MGKEEKQALRKEIKTRREALSEDYRKEAGGQIARNVIESEPFKNSRVLFAYISMKDEPDTRVIIEEALRQGKTVCVPKCYGKGVMDAIAILGYDDLKPGLLDIPEPFKLENRVEEGLIDLGIIPCISANKKGERIGHGAGYYDRFLGKTTCTTICLCFEKLTTESIPMSPKDRVMDYLATEEGLYKI